MEFKRTGKHLDDGLDKSLSSSRNSSSSKESHVSWPSIVLGCIFLVIFVFSVIIFKKINTPSTNEVNSFDQQNQIFLSKIKESVDIDNQTTRNYAVQLAANYPGAYNIDQVCFIYDHLYKNWRYVNDPNGFEFFSKASNTIDISLSGDCDDFAIILSALVQSIGGRTRISLAYNAESGHAFTEVYFNEDPQVILELVNSHYKDFFDELFGNSRVHQIYYRPDPDGGYWLNMDWTSKYPGGEYFDYTNCTVFYPLEGYYQTLK